MSSPEPRIQPPESVRRDVALFERIRARDTSAIAELYDRHSRMVYGLALRILRNRTDAEDVAQEVFLLVWNRVGTYEATLGSPAAWLAGVARNRAIDRLRANASRARTLDAASGGPGASDDPETRASLSEQQRAVLAALDAIPPEQRDLIEEAYYLGYTQSELAERHRLPLGTVKTRIRTGLQALRQQLAQIGVEQ